MPVALTGVFLRESPPLFDEAKLVTVISKEALPPGNDVVKSAELAAQLTRQRVKSLWDMTEKHEGLANPDDYSSSPLPCYTVWLINESSSSKKCRKWRSSIADALCSSCYPTLALNFLFQNGIKNGIADDEQRFTWARNVLGSLINFTDCSSDFRMNMLENGAVGTLVDFLMESSAVKADALNNAKYEEILRYVIAVIFNLAKMSSAKQAFIKCDASQVLQKYLDYQGDPYIKAAVAVCLATVTIDTPEMFKWLEENKIAELLVTFYVEADKTGTRRYHQLISCQEIADGLKILAISDVFKEQLIQLGILDVAADLLVENGRTQLEHYCGIEIVWTMCFGENGLQKVADHQGCIEAVRKIADSSEAADDVRQLARRTIEFIAEFEAKILKKSVNNCFERVDGDNEHVLLSYSGKYEEFAFRMQEVLEANGFEVWMADPTQATLDETAHAVENASVVVIAFSESYRRSPICRTEAEYAVALQKRIVAARVEKNYTPDGWLGDLIDRAKLQIEATEELESLWMDHCGPNLVSEVKQLRSGGEGNDSTPHDSNVQQEEIAAQSNRCVIQ